MRPLKRWNPAIKQQIPVEAVYAYIECKHNITKSTLRKAIEQTRSVKSHLLSRDNVENPRYEVDGPVYNGRVRDWPRQEPFLRNQPFTVIFGRKYDPKSFEEVSSDEFTPDLLVLGPDHFATQSANLGPEGIKGALFYDRNCGIKLRLEKVKEIAFGIGLVTLIQALEMIKLIPIDWRESLNMELWNSRTR